MFDGGLSFSVLHVAYVTVCYCTSIVICLCELVSDSQFDNSDCDMQLLINTCLYASANCFGSGLAQSPPCSLIKLKQFSRRSWFNCLAHEYFTPQTDFTSFHKTITAIMDNCQPVMQGVSSNP